MVESLRSLKGQFLIAMPGLKDPNFYRTVTFMTEHNAHGAMGVVFNRVHPKIRAKMVFDALKIAPGTDISRVPVHGGGPVRPNEIFILHEAPFEWKNSVMITPSVALSNSRDIIEAIAAGESPENFLVALGSAGWGSGQLERELHDNTWITSAGSAEIIFSLSVDTRWEAAIRALGIDPEQLSDMAGSA
ncbi:YqgE/AlgH family protein [Desulfosarcina sp. OttesenSCG-928-G17]|nr:YqgE/AlgH family protein [Desulfosarcina sp. OttesenSCG-928-G17]